MTTRSTKKAKSWRERGSRERRRRRGQEKEEEKMKEKEKRRRKRERGGGVIPPYRPPVHDTSNHVRPKKTNFPIV